MSISVSENPGNRMLSMDARGTIVVERWPGERPLLVVAVIGSLLIWLLLVVSIVGITYAAIFGGFFFLMHVAFVAHIRGNGVRLGPEQFPELYERVRLLAQRIGMERVPEAYIIQGGGTLNAFAARFLRTNILVLFTDLLEACGEDEAARDMIIGHELGHIHAGHLRWQWFLLPSAMIPFLGGALSRAREYTCDRYGLVGAGERQGALLGLAILAAGGQHGRLVNREALVRQRAELNTGWMSIGQWLSSHPPLAKRLLALDPSLGEGQRISSAGTVRGVVILLILFLPILVGSWFVVKYVAATAAEAVQAAEEAASYVAPDEEVAMEQLRDAVAAVAALLAAEVAEGRELPEDAFELAERWTAAHPEEALPIDPFDGAPLGYDRTAEGYVLWSSGPDQAPGTEDDIQFPNGSW
jgi:Zn-dependent protease with chaperone function